MTQRIPWTPSDIDVVRSTVAGSLTIHQMLDLLPGRPFAALRRRYMTFGSPDAETRHYRAMAIGSAALFRAVMNEVRV